MAWHGMAWHGMALTIEKMGEIDTVIGRWCLHKVPAHLKSQIDHDYEIDGQAVTLLEVRPVWRGQSGEYTRRPFARFRWVSARNCWQIDWMRQSGKWQAYEPCPAARNLEAALAVMEADAYGCFFG